VSDDDANKPSEPSKDAEVEARQFRARLETLLAPDCVEEIDFGELVKLTSWQGLRNAADAPKKAVASEFHLRLLEKYRAQRVADGTVSPQIGLFARAGGVYASLTGDFRITLVSSSINFDASAAILLLSRINDIAEEAQEWWPAKRGRSVTELARYEDRAYGLATFAVNAIAVENAAHRDTPTAEVPEPQRRFTSEMAVHAPRVARTEELLQEAIQRAMQARYGIGMALGLLVLAALAVGIAIGVDGLKITQGYTLGFVAGGLGAVVSVLQRMTRNRLQVVGRGPQLLWFGATRPLVGGLFGTVIIALLEARLINVETSAEGSRLALYGVLAFFAGFNERFARDALGLSASVLPTRSRTDEHGDNETS